MISSTFETGLRIIYQEFKKHATAKHAVEIIYNINVSRCPFNAIIVK